MNTNKHEFKPMNHSCRFVLIRGKKAFSRTARRLPIILLLPLAALGAEWLPIESPPGSDQFYYDASKLVIDGEEIAYWKKVVFRAVQPVKGRMAASALFRERIHCGEHTLKTLSHLYQGVDGSVIDYVESKDALAAPIIPESVGDLFEQTLCPQVRQKQEEAKIKAEQETAKAEPPKPAPAAPADEPKKKPIILP